MAGGATAVAGSGSSAGTVAAIEEVVVTAARTSAPYVARFLGVIAGVFVPDSFAPGFFGEAASCHSSQLYCSSNMALSEIRLDNEIQMMLPGESGFVGFWGPGGPDDDDDFRPPSQEHHLIPYANSRWAHESHALVRQANINIQTHQGNLMRLGNHSGPHSAQYHQTVRSMMDSAYSRVAGQGQGAARSALNGVMRDIRHGISNGTIKPYSNKSVWPM